MNATLEFTTRFYRNAQSKAFVDALHELRRTLLAVCESGPKSDGKRIIPLSHTTKRNIWRIRANIHPAPYRLFFEWVSQGRSPILRLIDFLPKKHRLCQSHNSAEFERLPITLVDGEKHRDLEARIRFSDQAPDGSSRGRHTELFPSQPNEKASLGEIQELAPSPVEHASEPDLLIVEPVDARDLIDLYASVELLQGFADLHGFTAEQRRRLTETETSDEAIAVIKSIDAKAENRFIEFLTDEEAPSDLERFYRLGGEDFSSLAQRPLSSFLLTVDAEQQKAIDKPIGKRPFMVGGAAGTGKSIVCLYRLLRMIEERTNESLFDGGARPTYLFITYTNSLVESSKSLFGQLAASRNLTDIDVRFSTLDSLLEEGARKLRDCGEKVPRPDRDRTNTAYWTTVRSPVTPEQHRRLLEEMGPQFFSHEVDEVLVDRNVRTLSEYLEKGERKELRKGLIIPLREEYRRAIWYGYQRLLEDVEKSGKGPFSLFRHKLLDIVSKNPAALPTRHVVIADEIQDLGEVQLKLITRMAKSPAGLLLARDSGQTIYRRQSAISAIDANLRFNSQNSVLLRRSYRMTRQIHTALSPLRQEVNRVHSRTEQAAKPVFTGPKPRWLRARPEDHLRIIATDILERIDRDGINPGQFAVIFGTNEEAKCFSKSFGSTLPVQVHQSRGFRIDDREAVHLLTAHSAKGLEFPYVYLPHASLLSAPRKDTVRRFDLAEQVDAGIKLLYVAGSRASATLTLLQESTAPSEALKLLKKAHWTYQDLTVK